MTNFKNAYQDDVEEKHRQLKWESIVNVARIKFWKSVIKKAKDRETHKKDTNNGIPNF